MFVRVCLVLFVFLMAPAVSAAAYIDAVMADNPIAYWSFEEDTGDFFDEVSGTANAIRGATTAMVAGPPGAGFIEGNPAVMPQYYFADGPATEDEKKNAYNTIMREQMERTK